AAIVSRIVEQSCSWSSAFSTASIWPRMRRTRLSSFFLSRMVWAIGSGSRRGHRTSSLYNTPVGYMQGPSRKHEVPMPQTPHVERHFTASETVRDIVIGMSDGLTVPFALAAGLSGAVEASAIILTAGLAEVAAGAIAMGLGGYLAAR